MASPDAASVAIDLCGVAGCASIRGVMHEAQASRHVSSKWVFGRWAICAQATPLIATISSAKMLMVMITMMIMMLLLLLMVMMMMMMMVVFVTHMAISDF